MILEKLPPELWTNIICHLPPETQQVLTTVNKYFKNLTINSIIFQQNNLVNKLFTHLTSKVRSQKTIDRINEIKEDISKAKNLVEIKSLLLSMKTPLASTLRNEHYITLLYLRVYEIAKPLFFDNFNPLIWKLNESDGILDPFFQVPARLCLAQDKVEQFERELVHITGGGIFSNCFFPKVINCHMYFVKPFLENIDSYRGNPNIYTDIFNTSITYYACVNFSFKFLEENQLLIQPNKTTIDNIKHLGILLYLKGEQKKFNKILSFFPKAHQKDLQNKCNSLLVTMLKKGHLEEAWTLFSEQKPIRLEKFLHFMGMHAVLDLFDEALRKFRNFRNEAFRELVLKYVVKMRCCYTKNLEQLLREKGNDPSTVQIIQTIYDPKHLILYKDKIFIPTHIKESQIINYTTIGLFSSVGNIKDAVEFAHKLEDKEHVKEGMQIIIHTLVAQDQLEEAKKLNAQLLSI